MHWGEKDFFFPPFPSQMELYFSGPQLPAGVAGSVHCHSSGMWLMPRVCDYNSSFLFLLSFSWWLMRSLFLSHNGLWNLSHFWQLLLNSDTKVLICIVRTKRSRWRLYFWPWFMLIHHWQKSSDKLFSPTLGLWFQSTSWKDSQWKWLSPAEGGRPIPKSRNRFNSV